MKAFRIHCVGCSEMYANSVDDLFYAVYAYTCDMAIASAAKICGDLVHVDDVFEVAAEAWVECIAE